MASNQLEDIESLDEADAIVFANVQGPKDKDYLATARALSYVKRQPEYGSNAKVAARYPIGAEMVREFLCLLELPDEIGQLFGAGKLKLEHGNKLYQLQRHDPEIVGRRDGRTHP